MRTCNEILALGVILTLMVFVGGCAPDRAPAARYIQQADQLHAGALESTIVPDPELNEYIQTIGERLEAAAQEIAPDKARGPFFKSMKFHLVDVPVINVFTTGGSHIYVYRGLFDYCRTEEELAAAMAHAYAHALNLDLEQTDLNPPEKPQPLRQVAWSLVVNRFEAQHEQESDKLAFRLYSRSGWDPAQFEVLFSRLSDEYPGPPAPDRDPLATRGALARGMTAGVPKKWRQPPVADPRTFEALRKHATSLRYASPASVEPRLYLVAFPNCILSYDLPEQRKAQEILRPPPPPEVELEPN
jgi:hypothetical protein